MKENNFSPLDMDPFKKEWEKKNEDAKPLEVNEGKKKTIERVVIPGISRPLFTYDGYGAYFLKNLPVLKIQDRLSEIEEGEEWKGGGELEDFLAKCSEAIESKIQVEGDKPFEVKFQYGIADILKERGIAIASEGSDFYYLPEEYGRDVDRFNEYVIDEVKKEASDDFAKQVRNINLN